MSTYTNAFRDVSRRAQIGLMAVVVASASIMPVLLAAKVQAAPALMERELQSTSARPGQATNLTWVFDTPDTPSTNLTKVEIEFCDSPLAACTVPNGATDNGNTPGTSDKIPLLPASPTATLSGPWSSTANTATRVNGLGTGTSNQIDISLTTPGDNDNLDELQIAIPGFTNDEEANASYYTRMRMYDGATLIYEGVSAQSTSQTLTVNARVQERLDFCVGATAVNDADTTNPTPGGDQDCVEITGTAVDIGNVENGFTNVSPVDTVNGGSDTNGIAMVRTNAVNGVVVDYRSVQETGSGALKVAGATCSGPTVTTDQCFNSADADNDPLTAGAAAINISAGTEKFGMVVAGVNCESVSAYTCDFAGGVYNLIRDTEYDGTDNSTQNNNTYVADLNQVPATTSATYAWLSNGAVDRIASSASSAVKVVDDEALILKFAATAGVTTPTGAYTVQSDFIATTTF